MTFTPDDFVKLEAQRQALVQEYITQRDANRTETAMTDDELKAIEARANAATPGPWEVEQKECTVLRAPNGPPSDQSLMGDEQYYPWTPDRIEDWQFIAATRTDVPALVAEVRRLREALTGISRQKCPVCEGPEVAAVMLRGESLPKEFREVYLADDTMK